MTDRKPIGPSFEAELRTAGLLGLAFSWGPDGVIEFHPDVPADQRAAVLAVYEAHDPEKPAPASGPTVPSSDITAALRAAIDRGDLDDTLERRYGMKKKLMGLALFVVLGFSQPVAANDLAVVCQGETRALDMYAAKLRKEREAFELQVFRTLAEKDAALVAGAAENTKLVQEIARLKKKYEPEPEKKPATDPGKKPETQQQP
jgi:hypothetical protein